MKAKEIAKRVQATHFAAILVDKTGAQWVTDGKNAYIADDTIQLTESNLLSVLDIEQKKRDKIRVGMGEAENGEQHACDELLDALGIEARPGDSPLMPGLSVNDGELLTSMQMEDGGVCWVAQGVIKPADTDEGLSFAKRGRYVIAGNLFASAVLEPISEGRQQMLERQLRAVVGVENDEELLSRLEEAEKRAAAEHARAEAAVKRAVRATNDQKGEAEA